MVVPMVLLGLVLIAGTIFMLSFFVVVICLASNKRPVEAKEPPSISHVTFITVNLYQVNTEQEATPATMRIRQTHKLQARRIGLLGNK